MKKKQKDKKMSRSVLKLKAGSSIGSFFLENKACPNQTHFLDRNVSEYYYKNMNDDSFSELLQTKIVKRECVTVAF